MKSILEHANINVSDPLATATWLSEIFGWSIRWQGSSLETGFSVHVGTETGYVALLAYGQQSKLNQDRHTTIGATNHIGIFVDDIDEAERRVISAGFEPRAHQDYAPGRRFYFFDNDGLEWEVASHQSAA